MSLTMRAVRVDIVDPNSHTHTNALRESSRLSYDGLWTGHEYKVSSTAVCGRRSRVACGADACMIDRTREKAWHALHRFQWMPFYSISTHKTPLVKLSRARLHKCETIEETPKWAM